MGPTLAGWGLPRRSVCEAWQAGRDLQVLRWVRGVRTQEQDEAATRAPRAAGREA